MSFFFFFLEASIHCYGIDVLHSAVNSREKLGCVFHLGGVQCLRC